jgi:2-C-methyl-D-erythritol 4-phosphate cytidylyltransferase
VDDEREGSVWAVVAAAGESRRMGLPEGESKQFLLLGGEPVICHSVRRLLSIPAIAGVVVVLHPSHTVRFAGELLRLEESKPILIAEGGRERCDSIRAGLLEVPQGTEYVAVHDGARPLFSKHVFEDCLSLLAGPGAVDGAIPACRVADTLKRADDQDLVVETIDRSGLWAVQTPQLFRAAALRAAYSRPDIMAATDDAALLERAGRRVVVVPSTPGNVKITTPGDLPLAGAVLSWEVEADV